MENKKISLSNEERITLQALIKMELKKNEKYKKMEIEPCINNEGLKNLFKKIAGYECEENRRKLKEVRKMNISKNDVLTFMAAVASIINLLIQWMS